MMGKRRDIRRSWLWLALLVGAIVVTGCSRVRPEANPMLSDVAEPEGDVCVDNDTGTQMTLQEAIAIGEASACVEEGALTEAAQCNSVTGTWWIDLDIDEPGCMPACVISLNDRTAEVNWRCTGVVEPETALPITSSAEPAPDESPLATPEAPPEETAEPVPAMTPEDLSTWAKYADSDYGFFFRYPPDWTIELLTERPAGPDGEPAATAVQLTKDSLQILVEYKAPEETSTIGPDSLPEGIVEERGTVTLLDRQVPRHILADGGQDKVVFAGDQFPDIELYIQMNATSDDETVEAGISEEALEIFDQIVATFSRTLSAGAADPYEGWGSYTSDEIAPGYSFGFRYPEDWTLTERPAGRETGTGPAAAMIELTKDTYILQIQYKAVGDDSVMITGDTPESLLMEAGTAWFMSQPVSRFVVVSDDTLQRVLLTYSDDTVLVSVELQQDPTAADEEVGDIPAAIRDEVDQILASFETSAP